MKRAYFVWTLSRLLALTSLIGCFDPVVENQIDALGGEAPGVRQGPTHRPGQPCLLCHDGNFGDPVQFTIAGTVFNDPVDLGGEDGTTVLITDSAGTMKTFTTNTVGNFYVTADQWSPVFPLAKVGVISAQGISVSMQSEVGRNGACATCHVSPAGPMSPGPVVITLADGGTPP